MTKIVSDAERKVYESIDLVRHIYSFGTPGHRTFTRHLKLDVRSYPELLREKYYSEKLVHGYVSCSMKEYLYHYSTRRLLRYLRNFKRCYCCTRHSTDLPMWINHEIVLTGPSVFENQDAEDSSCECCCRSLSRNIMRNLQERELMYPEY